MTGNELLDLLRERRSVRRFRKAIPPRELIERILESAITAPSSSNKQPWRFLVVYREDLRARLAAAVRAARDRLAAHIDPQYEPAFREYSDYFTCFEDAPVVIVPLFRGLPLLSQMTAGGPSVADQEAVAAMERDSGLISTSLAMQNLLLAAHAEGLGAACMTGPLIAREDLRALLDIPESWHPVAFIPIGYPAETPEPTQRKPLEKVVRWLT